MWARTWHPRSGKPLNRRRFPSQRRAFFSLIIFPPSLEIERAKERKKEMKNDFASKSDLRIRLTWQGMHTHVHVAYRGGFDRTSSNVSRGIRGIVGRDAAQAHVTYHEMAN